MTAAAARKLQKDIDGVLKKVDDGIEEFGDVWEQATSSSNSSQKEKLGEELKRSINKLQRFRAQIREWIGQNDVKCKDKLEEARKRIEVDMQRFKEFERDLKTKAFSTCALAKQDELEIEEVEKMKSQEWLMSTIQEMNDKLDEFEADLETLENRKSLSSDDKSRVSELKTFQERFRWHIKKLELILRALDNDTIDVTDLACVRESVDMYIENHQDPDWPHDETLYDCFDLAEFEDRTPKPMTLTPTAEAAKETTPKEEPAKKGKEKDKRKKDDKRDKKREEREKKAAAASPANGSSSTKANGSDSRTPKASEEKGILDDIDWNEVKVQEDQLLSEAEEFICKICQIHVVGCSPKLTNCSHLFCGDCIAQWFNQHPQSQTWAQRAKSAGCDGRVVPCPVCKQPLNEKKDLYPVCGATSRSENLLLWRMLSSLKIMCVHHSKLESKGACDWIGEYGQYQKHITCCKNEPNAAKHCVEASPKQDFYDSTPALDRGGSISQNATPVNRSAATETAWGAGVYREPSAAESSPVAARSSGYAKAGAIKADPERSAKPWLKGSLQEVGAASPPRSPARPPPGSPSTASSVLSAAAANAAAVAAEPHAASVGAMEQRPTRATQEDPYSVSHAPKPSSLGAQTEDIVQATSVFEPTGTNMVQVQPGHSIHILERHTSGWTYCKNMATGVTGWAPSWAVQPAAQTSVPAARGAETGASTDLSNTSGSPNTGRTAVPPVALKVDDASRSQAPAPSKDLLRPSSQMQTAVAAAPTPQQAQQAPNSETAPAVSTPKAPLNEVRAAQTFFTGTNSSQLTLVVNDLVEIIERHPSGWTYGRKVHQGPNESVAPVEGWFPDWVSGQ